MNRKLHALPRMGGKSYNSRSGTGRWIAGLLPEYTDGAYVEPFFGMGGVLLQRRPSRMKLSTTSMGG